MLPRETSGVWVPPWIWEAITTTAASHEPGHDCVACRAAAGDGGAAAQIIRATMGYDETLLDTAASGQQRVDGDAG